MRTTVTQLTAVLLTLSSAAIHNPSHAGFTHDKQEEDGKVVSIMRLTVTPAGEPELALRNRFVLPLHERVAGNAAVYYLRSYGEGNLRGPWDRAREELGNDLDQFLKPERELPLAKLRRAAGFFDTYMEHYLARATRCRECDWGLEEMDLRGLDTIEFRLPDLNESRSIARAIALQTRLAIAEQRYDDAIELMRMNFQLAQDFGKQRFFVATLVGLAEVTIATETVAELIAAPGSPNLFWPLSELPRPIISARDALSLEMSIGFRLFPSLMEAEKREPTAEEWQQLVATMLELLDQQDGNGNTAAVTQQRVADVSKQTYPGARQRLVDSGFDVQRLDQMSQEWVLMIDAAREYRRITDQLERLWYLPFYQSKNLLAEADQHLRKSSDDDGMGHRMASGLAPAMFAIKSAQMRSQRTIDALRVIEALRMHAAETGALPGALDEIKAVPVPDNPMTRKPFNYRRERDTAILELPDSDGTPNVSYRFVIALGQD